MDWRQLSTQAAAPGAYQVVVGLYHPATGERFTLVDETGAPLGNEAPLGEVILGPPAIPDQACALIPLACASQSTP
ncbi:MAG: hypothetical protein D6790_18500 [Caldilineae bacterium]|nr:MAG: hypothetical protein D6790_18500 [Caldilineae bacterium]